MNQQVVKQFFDVWAIYEEVLDQNYMFHNELFAQVGRILGGKFALRSFSIMDLGCGSARHSSAILRNRNIGSYVGCDISEVALEYTRRNLAALDCPQELRCADLLAALEDGYPKVDVIFSSFAVHHLSCADKHVFFQRAFRQLTENGLLLLIDCVRDEGEERVACLERYCKWIQTDWTSFPDEVKATMYEHIKGNDFPEMSSTMCEMAVSAGFRDVEEVCRFRGHCVWLFTR